MTKIRSVRLHRVQLPIRTPFTTSFSTQHVRELVLVELQAESQGLQVTGWGECVALPEPVYSPDHCDGAIAVIEQYLVPALLDYQRQHELTAETVGHALRRIIGHQMAKAALEMAVLDAELRAAGRSFASYLGATADRVPSGVLVGIMDSIPELLSAVGDYLEAGYQRVKLKIMPGWDLEPVAAVRREFGEIPLQVDANTAYRLQRMQHTCVDSTSMHSC